MPFSQPELTIANQNSLRPEASFRPERPEELTIAEEPV
jgi:hypothetical protein